MQINTFAEVAFLEFQGKNKQTNRNLTQLVKNRIQ